MIWNLFTKRSSSSSSFGMQNRLVTVLAGVGLGTGALMLAAVSWSLGQIRNDRTRSDRIHYDVTRTLHLARNLVADSLRSSQALLNNDASDAARWRNESEEALQHLISRPKSTLQFDEIGRDLSELIDELRLLHHASHDFAERRNNCVRILTKVRKDAGKKLHRLRASFDSSEGKELLDLAVKIRKFRSLQGTERSAFAEQVLSSWSHNTGMGANMIELIDLTLLVERLVAEDDVDALVDIKDNQLQPTLDRFRRTVRTEADPERLLTNARMLSDFEDSLFGRGFRRDTAHQTIELGKGGLYNMQWTQLQLRNEKQNYEVICQRLSKQFRNLRRKLLLHVDNVSRTSNDQAARLVSATWYTMAIFGGTFGAIFLIIARKISATIQTQFGEINQQADHLKLLSLVVKYTDNAVVISNARNEIEWANEGFQHLTGFDMDEVRGKLFHQVIFRHESNSQMVDVLSERMKHRLGYDDEILIRTKDGESRWLAIEVRPILDEQNEVVQFIAIHSDITERREKEHSLRLLRAGVDHATESMFTISKEGHIVDANIVACERLGYSRQELLQLRISDFVQNLTDAAWGKHWDYIREERSDLVESKHVDKNGVAFPVEVSFVYVKYRGLEYVCAFAREITERKFAERQITATARLVEESLNEVFIFDIDTLVFCYANRTALQNSGYSAAELYTMTPIDLKPTLSAEEFQSLLTPLRFGEVPTLKFETIHRRKDGTNYNVEVHMQTTDYLDRRCFVANIWDTTERKRAESESAKLAIELQNAARQAGMAEVATGVLHNVGNILNSVNVSASLVKEKLQQSSITKLEKATNMLLAKKEGLGDFLTKDERGKHFPNLLNQLSINLTRERETELDEMNSLVSHIEHIKEIVSMQQSIAKSGGLYENLDLIELTEYAIKVHQTAIMHRDITIERDFDEVPPVESKRHEVLQILINLVKNAIQAMEEQDGIQGRLKIGLRVENDSIRIEVSDNGVGISADHLENIFRHGFTTKKDGHGFGLHAGANAAQEMGGSLSVHSEGEGKGATFALRLPLQHAVADNPVG